MFDCDGGDFYTDRDGVCCGNLWGSEMSIYAKLQKARAKLHAQKLKKTGSNNGKPFFELGDFMPVAISIFDDVGLCGVCSFTSEFATLTIYDTESDQTIVITSPFGSAELRGCHPVQNIGAVETYQRRYLWMTALDIIEHDGIDADSGDSKQPIPEAEQKRYEALDKRLDECLTSEQIADLSKKVQQECADAKDHAAWDYFKAARRVTLEAIAKKLAESAE